MEIDQEMSLNFILNELTELTKRNIDPISVKNSKRIPIKGDYKYENFFFF